MESKHALMRLFQKSLLSGFSFFFSSLSLADKKLHRSCLLGLGNQRRGFTAPGEVNKPQSTRAEIR